MEVEELCNKSLVIVTLTISVYNEVIYKYMDIYISLSYSTANHSLFFHLLCIIASTPCHLIWLRGRGTEKVIIYTA